MRTGLFNVRHGNVSHPVAVGPEGRVSVGETTFTVTPVGDREWLVRGSERSWTVFVGISGHERQVFVDGEVFEMSVGPEGTPRPTGSPAAAESLSAPMPARVVAILVEPGRAVRKGDVLLTLEAMKMELPIRAPHDGTIGQIACQVGDMVQPGVGLVEVTEPAP